MTYRVLVGEQKSLVFPVMCYGYLTVDYESEVADANANSITTDDEPYGIFGHSDSFTIQTILTPYDINGLGESIEVIDNPSGNAGITTSMKTMPAQQLKSYTVGSTAIVGTASPDTNPSNDTTSNYYTHSESETYLPIFTTNRRKDYEMIIFHNTNVELSLVNGTSGANNVPIRNQPAEYKIKFSIIADGVSDSLISNKVILADTGYSSNNGSILTTEGYTTDNLVNYEAIAAVSGSFYVDTQWQMTSGTNENALFAMGENLYTRSGQTFTKVATTTTDHNHSDPSYIRVVYEAGKGLSDVTSKMIYREAKKEALYLLKRHHIAATFDENSGEMVIYYDGSPVMSKTHSQYPIGNFNFNRSDCYIGAKYVASNMDQAWTRKQFMGELQEFAILDGIHNSFLTLETLMPNFRNTLLYYRFEEVDL
mgnify:CR=1 FL=1